MSHAIDTESNEQTTISTELQKNRINLPKLLDVTGGLLHHGFIASKKEIGKKRFRELKKGANPAVGEVRIGKDLEFEVRLALDYSQFVGPGFNFDVYQRFVKGLLGVISAHLKSRKEFNFLTGDKGSVLIDLPVALEIKGQINVMFLIYEFGNKGDMTINLSFFDPAQFRRVETRPETA